MEGYFRIPLINKYFRNINGNISCADLLISGDYERAFNEYTYVYKQIPTVIEDEIGKIYFQEMVIIRMKEAIRPSVPLIGNVIVSDSKVMLGIQDFPDDYVNMSHSEDYILKDKYIGHELIINKGIGKTRRLICRISWKSENHVNKYVSMSFICDTGAPKSLYLSPVAYSVLLDSGRIKEDEIGSNYVLIEGKKFGVLETPAHHQPANLMGLFLLSKFGMNIHEDTFAMNSLPLFF